MPRTSKKEKQARTLLVQAVEDRMQYDTKQCYTAGIYARLSVDNRNEKNESIETQIEIAKDFLNLHKEIKLYDCYTDLGKTGTNFERKSFQRLMQDIRLHKVDCVIVKDFSRFGRDYIETGNYLEKIFPFLGVRFISITDHFDSLSADSVDSKMSVNLKNLVNEMYATDIAARVKTAKKIKQEQGGYTGGIPPYGYCTERQEGKTVLFPEPETAAIVKEMFRLYDKGRSMVEIVEYLYEQRIHRPTDYRIYGHIIQQEGELLKQWSKATVKSVLKNPVYIGTLVQGRFCGKDRMMAKRNGTPTQDWCLRVNTHEAIIDSEMYYRIAERFETQAKSFCNKDGFSKNVPLEEDIFSGMLYCGVCGHTMGRSNSIKEFSGGDKVRMYIYRCNNSARIDTDRCSTGYITKEKLLSILKEVLSKEFNLRGIKQKDVVGWNRRAAENVKETGRKEMQEIMRKMDVIREQISNSYLKYRMGELSREAFKNQKKEDEGLLSLLDNRCHDIEKKLSEMECVYVKRSQFLRSLLKWRQDGVLDKQVLQELVERIQVYPGKRVEITFCFTANTLWEGGWP